MGDVCTPRLVGKAMEKLDTNKDGQLTLEEFYSFFVIIDELLD